MLWTNVMMSVRSREGLQRQCQYTIRVGERKGRLTNGFDQESFSISREHFDDDDEFFFFEGRVGCRSYNS